MADYYQDKESAEQRNRELRKKYEAQLEQAKQKTEQIYKQYGLNPAYDKEGNISGFTDNIVKMSYRIEELGNMRPEILPQLKQAGVIDYTEGKVEVEKPILGYKNIFTGEIKSVAPELAQALGGYIAVPISSTTGKELTSIQSQLQVRADNPEAFVKISTKEPTWISKVKAVAPSLLTASTLFGPSAEVKKIKEAYEKIPEEKKTAFYEKAKEEIAGGIGFSIDTLTFKGPRTAFMETAKGLYGTLPENIRKKINTSIQGKLSTAPIKIRDKEGNLVSYRKITGKQKITFEEYYKLLKQPLIEVQEQRFNLSKEYADKLYNKSFTNLVYEKNKEKLDKKKITWEKAIENTSKTKEWKNLENLYQKAFDKKYKESVTTATMFADIAVPTLDILPKTYVGVGAVAGAGLVLGTVATPTIAAGVLASKPITNISNMLYGAYEPTTKVGRFAKASVFSAAITGLAPVVGVAYGAELGKGIITKPEKTTRGMLDFLTTKPEEFAGFAVGGALVTRGLRYAELKARGLMGRAAKTQTINIKGYGDVVVQTVPKYGEVVWIKGAYAATEEVAVMKQVNK